MSGLAGWFANSLIGRYVIIGLAILAGLAFKQKRDERRGREAAKEAMQKEDRDVAKDIRNDVRRSRADGVRPSTIVYRD